MNPYWFVVKNDLPRFLAQFDNNPISKTFGSFDRMYWHHKRTDYSSAACQQGHLFLAQLYVFKDAENPLYNNPETLKMIFASLSFTCQIQHSDGSLDEWYPQERGWAGPTGYVLYSVAESLRLLKDVNLPEELFKKLKLFSSKATDHLLHFEERDVLSNHQAMSLLAIHAAAEFFELKVDPKKMANRWLAFENNFNEEGWSLEYDGCDPGYQSATVSFLSRLDRIAPSDKIKNLCLRQIKFLRNFIFPDGSFAGSMGSRGTNNVFHFGFEYWKSQSIDADYLACNTQRGLEMGSVLMPKDQEDHYFIYRLVELMDCALIYAPQNHTFQFVAQQIYFKNCGMMIISNDHFFGILNLKKNAAGRIYSHKLEKYIFNDSGYYLHGTNDKNYTSSFIQNNRVIKITNDSVKVSGVFNQYSRPVFNQNSFILFRIILLFVRNAKIALLLKQWIRSKVMTEFRVEKSMSIERTIDFKSDLKITDYLFTNHIKITKAFRTMFIVPRSVPQSLYCTQNQIGESQYVSLSDQQLKDLNTLKKIKIEVL